MSKTRLNQLQTSLQQFMPPPPAPPRITGKLIRVTGLTLEVAGLQAPLGARCLVERGQAAPIEAEVVGFEAGRLFLMPIELVSDLVPGARVWQRQQAAHFPAGRALLGRVVDALGRPLDDQPLVTPEHVSLHTAPHNPLSRKPITEPLDVGVRAINGLLTLGQGQRVGLIAGTGVGKSVLLGMITRFTEAEIVVVGLIGERGREVGDFIRTNLGEQGLAKSVVVAAPADTSPLMRLQGALYATALAEYFRDQGHRVLLLMDSLTRYAQAQREIALAAGEPPVTKGYPPSVFTRIPQLVERAGNAGDSGGTLTAIYTLLAEGDDTQDPVVDAGRGVLDGHIVLSRALADSGHYPAIDVAASVSRLMVDITTPQHQQLARRFKQLYAAYETNQDMISLGMYRQGSDPLVDEAIRRREAMNAFLVQGIEERVSFDQSVQQLAQVLQ